MSSTINDAMTIKLDYELPEYDGLHQAGSTLM